MYVNDTDRSNRKYKLQVTLHCIDAITSGFRLAEMAIAKDSESFSPLEGNATEEAGTGSSGKLRPGRSRGIP